MLKRMNCVACGHTLDSKKSIFMLLCPQCGTVNLPSESLRSQPEIHSVQPFDIHTEIVSVVPATSRWKLPKFTRKLAIIYASVLLFISLGGGILFYQNNQAVNLLKSARSSIARSDYAGAQKILSKAAKFYSLPSTHRQIAALSASDKGWIEDSKLLQTALQLDEKGDYTKVAGVLAQISKDFPEYSKVLTLTGKVAEQIKAVQTALIKAPQTTPPLTVSKPKPVPAVSAAPKSKAAKRFTSTAAASSLAAATTVTQAQQALQAFASQYSLTMEITAVTPSSYVTTNDTYDLVTNADLASLKTYGSIFIDEWAKYPTDWVTASKLKSVALIKNFATAGTHRSSGPDPFGEAMYYDVTYSGDYAREVLHHEFDHLFTYNYFNAYQPSDPTWQSYNTPGFTYGNGGASCYIPGNSCLTGEHPIPGFATGYGASAMEEDKAELYAYLMTGTYYHHLKGWLAGDAALTNKVNNYKQFISSHSPEMAGSYYDDINP